MRERRKYRDYTPEIEGFYNLLGAVIKQAYEDVKTLPHYRKELRTITLQDTIHRKKHRGSERLHKAREQVSAGKDARAFFESDRVNTFINQFRLPLEVDYLRRKYYQILENQKQERYKKRRIYVSNRGFSRGKF